MQPEITPARARPTKTLLRRHGNLDRRTDCSAADASSAQRILSPHDKDVRCHQVHGRTPQVGPGLPSVKGSAIIYPGRWLVGPVGVLAMWLSRLHGYGH